MPSYNKVVLMGHLTRDPELRVTTSGLSICKIGLAINRAFTNSHGDLQEEVCFVDVDAFGRQADTIAKYMVKGRPILVEGRLKLDRWQTRQGEQRSKLCVVLETFKFLGRGAEDNGNGNGYTNGHAQPAQRGTKPVQQNVQRAQRPAASEDGHATETVNTAEQAIQNGEEPF